MAVFCGRVLRPRPTIDRAALETVFLDAGGVLLFPNWHRISDALARQGVVVSPAALSAAEPHARRVLDDQQVVGATTDASRGWLFFDLILDKAGVTASAATKAALAELHAYHVANNLWEFVPDDVRPALTALRDLGLKLTIVSNANGTLCAHLERLGLTGSSTACWIPATSRSKSRIRGSSRSRWPAVAHGANRRFMSATCTTSTSSAREMRGCAACCSTRPI